MEPGPHGQGRSSAIARHSRLPLITDPTANVEAWVGIVWGITAEDTALKRDGTCPRNCRTARLTTEGPSTTIRNRPAEAILAYDKPTVHGITPTCDLAIHHLR